MARPLLQYRIDQLEKMFVASRTNEAALRQLADELQHRDVPRALALRAQVEKALRGTRANPDAPVAPAITTTSASSVAVPEFTPAPAIAGQTNLWPERGDDLLFPSIAPPVPPTQPSVSRVLSDATPPTQRPESGREIPAMSAEAAYKVLKATPGTPWEVIEQTRRQLVEQANPGRIASLNSERRIQVQADAKRANAAYAVLRMAKGGEL